MKQRQDTKVPGTATNTDVLLKVAKDRLECSFDSNVRMPLLVFHRLFSSLNQYLPTSATQGQLLLVLRMM